MSLRKHPTGAWGLSSSVRRLRVLGHGLWCFICFTSLLIQGVSAQSSLKEIYDAEQTVAGTPEGELFKKIGHELRCPTCIGHSILESEAPFALQMREALLGMVKDHKAPDDIREFFLSRYGEWILREPPQRGFHWLAWLIPMGFMLVAVVCVGALLKHKKASGTILKSYQEIEADMQKELAVKRGLRSQKHVTPTSRV